MRLGRSQIDFVSLPKYSAITIHLKSKIGHSRNKITLIVSCKSFEKMDMVFNTMLKTAQIVTTLRNGGVGVVPTDTIYGIVGSALNPQAVERIYKLRRRNPKKPMIILIGSLGDLRLFDIRPSRKMKKLLKKFW